MESMGTAAAKGANKGTGHRAGTSVPAVIVRKHNSLIQSIGKTTLLSNKIFLTALLRLEDRQGVPSLAGYYKNLENMSGTDYSRGLVAEFTSGEVRKLMGTKSGSFYEAVQNLMDPKNPNSLKNQWSIFIKDKESGLYGSTDVITSTLYDGTAGKLYIKFSSEQRIREALIDYRSNFTSLNYSLMMRFKSVYTYRLYEILMSRIGYEDGLSKAKKDEYCYNYGFSELKYLLGILDANANREVREAVQGPNPDYDKIENIISGEQAMTRFSDFQRYTLAKAKKEIDAAKESEFNFDYKPVRSGRGGKVVSVDLYMIRKEKILKGQAERELDKEKALDEACDLLFQAVGKPMKIADCRAIVEAAGYDIKKVEKAIAFMQASGSIIENVVGYMISAIKNDYGDPVEHRPEGARKNEGRLPLGRVYIR